MGKAHKKYVNKIAKKTEEFLAIKSRKQTVLAMEDDKEYYDKKFNLTMTGREWKEIIKFDKYEEREI
jgi:hypothetical protein